MKLKIASGKPEPKEETIEFYLEEGSNGIIHLRGRSNKEVRIWDRIYASIYPEGQSWMGTKSPQVIAWGDNPGFTAIVAMDEEKK
jgi:hypothetical protein